MESANTSSDEELAAPGHAVETGTGERPHPGDIVIDRDLGIAPWSVPMPRRHLQRTRTTRPFRSVPYG